MHAVCMNSLLRTYICVCICDRIAKTCTSKFSNLEDSQNLLQMPESCRVCKVTIPLIFLQILGLYIVPTRFYESLNEEIACVNYSDFPIPVTYIFVSMCICIIGVHMYTCVCVFWKYVSEYLNT